MPNYDFTCNNCKLHFSSYVTYEDYDQLVVVCPRCDSKDVQQEVNRVQVAKSDSEHLKQLSNGFDIHTDPKSLGKMMRHVQEQSGVKMDGPFDEVVNRLQKGESISKIDKDYGADV